MFPGREVGDTVHADVSTWKMSLPGTTAVTQGMMAERKGLFVNIRVGGLLLRWKKKGSKDYIH